MNTEKFIEKLNFIWGENTFDTSKCEYVRSSDKVTLICKKHNLEFQIRPTQLVSNKNRRTGCKSCQKEILGIIPTESEIQAEFVKWMRSEHPKILFTCNGQFNNMSNVQKNYQMGYLKGIPDLFVINYKLFIEFKSSKGKLTQSQKDIQDQLKELGYNVYTCYSLDEAKNILQKFI